MIVSTSALLDACVLMPINLTDVLLRLAKAGTFRPLWSAEVLDEVRRNLPRASAGMTPEKSQQRVSAMRTAFADAEVSGYEWLLPTLTNHPKDRHVLAAAVHGGAEVIVTANLSDFPPGALRPHGVEAVHPDAFLLALLDLHPEIIAECLQNLVAAKRKPQETLGSFLTKLAKVAPRFTEEVQRSTAC